MTANQIVSTLTANLAEMPAQVSVPMIAYTFATTKQTAAKALEMLVAAGVLKQSGNLFVK